MSGWYRCSEIGYNIVVFASFVVLPLLLIVCEIGDAFERQKAKEQRIRCELRKESEKIEIEIKKEEEEDEGVKNEN